MMRTPCAGKFPSLRAQPFAVQVLHEHLNGATCHFQTAPQKNSHLAVAA
jgi:hypothetical protein